MWTGEIAKLRLRSVTSKIIYCSTHWIAVFCLPYKFLIVQKNLQMPVILTRVAVFRFGYSRQHFSCSTQNRKILQPCKNDLSTIIDTTRWISLHSRIGGSISLPSENHDKKQISAQSSKAICSTLEAMTPETRVMAEQLSQTRSTTNNSDKNWKHRVALSKAITLIESKASDTQDQAELLLTYLLKHHRETERYRIGM